MKASTRGGQWKTPVTTAWLVQKKVVEGKNLFLLRVELESKKVIYQEKKTAPPPRVTPNIGTSSRKPKEKRKVDQS